MISMSSIFDITQEYLNQLKTVENLNRKVKSNISFDDEDSKALEFEGLKKKLNAQLAKTEPVIKKVTLIYEHKGLEFSDGKVYINGNLPRKPIDFDEEECSYNPFK